MASSFRCRRSAGMVSVACLVLAGCTADAGDQEGEPTADEASEGSAALEPLVVTEFVGEGDETTDTFEVEDGWEMRWETTGESFQVELLEVGGDSLGKVIDHKGEGGGSAYPSAEGELELAVSAEGPWSVRVITPVGDGE
jgi:hypothetical protein